MKKLIIALVLLALPTMASACTYDHVTVDSDGTVHGRWIPCNNPDCPDYQKHVKMIENQRIVYEHDVSKDKQDSAIEEKYDRYKTFDSVDEHNKDKVRNDARKHKKDSVRDSARKRDKDAVRDGIKKHDKVRDGAKSHDTDKVQVEIDKHDRDKVRDDARKHDKGELHGNERKHDGHCDAGKIYDRKQHRERDVEAAVAEQEAINKLTGPLPEGTIVVKKNRR